MFARASIGDTSARGAMALRQALARVATSLGAATSSGVSSVWGTFASRAFTTSSIAEAKKPALSGWATWKRAQTKRSRAQGAKHWNARVLSKQAQKVRGHLIERWKIYRGDQVMVNTGKDRGQVGTVTKVFRKENRLIVEGMNLVKKHVKRTEQNQGGVISMEAPIHYSNVNLVDPVTGSPVRIAMRYLDDGRRCASPAGDWRADPSSRNRTCMQRRRPRSTKVGSRDTSWQDALRNTYAPSPESGGSSGGRRGIGDGRARGRAE